MKIPRAITGSVTLGLSLMLLNACASRHVPADWELASQSASQRAVAAYLKGERRVTEVEWNKAYAEASATGLPAAMAHLALLECAAQTAALELQDCPRYQRYAAGAQPQAQAYARYLQVQHGGADVSLLPAPQQAMAAQLLFPDGGPVGLASTAPASPEQALSLLTAAGVALRAGRLAPEGVRQASKVAAAQGWRRAAMAWLLVEKKLAAQAGDAQAVSALELRLQVLQEGAKADSQKK